MLVVADTSPLNYLVWIELAGILPHLYGSVIIPPDVRDELLAQDAPLVVRAWASNLPAWVHVQAPDGALRDDSRWRLWIEESERQSRSRRCFVQPRCSLMRGQARPLHAG